MAPRVSPGRLAGGTRPETPCPRWRGPGCAIWTAADFSADWKTAEARGTSTCGTGLRHQPLDVAELASLLRSAEAGRLAARCHACGASDAVHVVLGDVGEIEAPDVANLRHVDAPGGDVGRHQDPELPLFEPVQRLLPLVLGPIGMETRDAVSGVLEHPRHLVGPVLGAGEDQRAQVVLGQQREEQGRLLRLGDAVDALICPLRGGATPRDLDPRRVPQMAVEIGNLSGHRRGEERRLSVAREGGQDAGELGLEPHVQHPVRLVEDQELDVAKETFRDSRWSMSRPGVAMTSWGREWSATARGHAHPTDDQGRAHAAGRSEAGGVLVDLDGQLARRSEHQRPRPLLAGETLHQRKDEGGSLAGAGGGEADDVLARKGRGDRSGLDRRGDG